MKKRLWMPILFLTTMLCVPVLAEDESVWNFDTSNYALDGYTGVGGDVVVPDTILGCPVDIIGMQAFGSSDTLTSLTLPEGVKQLEGYVAGWCNSLKEVSLPESLLVIGQNCFASDPLLEQITIPSQVCYIDVGAFGFCDSLKSITFTGECPILGKDVFINSSADAVIYVPDDQLDAYTEALEAAGCYLPVQPSGQNAIACEPVYDTENLVFDAPTGTITAYKGFHVRLDIPETIDGVPVTSIGDNAFNGHLYLSYVTLPEGLTSIGNDAFKDASTLWYVDFPSTLKTIGDGAFCRSYEGAVLNLPEGIESIGDEAFYYATMWNDLELPEGLKTIGESAFYQCPWVSTVHLPSTLEKIGSLAFANSTSITYLVFDLYDMVDIASDAFSGCPVADLDLPWDSSFENKDAYESVMAEQCPDCTVWINNPGEDVAELPSNDVSISTFVEGVWTEYHGEAENLSVWTDVDDYDVTGLGDGLFKGNQTIRSFYPHHCGWFTTIGNEAFADSSVEYVELFGTITTIGDGAFRNCVNMKELTIPASVTSIGAGAFEGCQGLEKITIQCDASLLYEGVFAGCPNLTEVTIEKGAVPADCFADSSLTTVCLGDEVTAIGDRAFANTDITELSLANITSIGEAAFENTQLAKAELSDSLTSLGEHAFAGTQVTAFVIPSGLEPNAEVLAGIPTSGIRMSDKASDEQLAAWNGVLDYPWYNHLVRESEESVFTIMPFVPTAEDYFEMDEATGTITAYTGDDVDVVIPRSINGVEVTSIGYNAFGCSPEMATNQEDGLQLRSVVVPETVTSICDSAFEYCQQLETFICYGPLESSGRAVFYNCQSLKNVVFVNQIKMLDNYLFDSCSSLKTVWYKGQLDLIGENCFRGAGLESMIINAKKISGIAFTKCTSLKEVHVRDGVESLSLGAFHGCSSLTEFCFEFSDSSVIDNETDYMTEEAEGYPAGAVMRLPASTSDEDYAEFYRLWKKGNLGPVEDEAHLIREDCTEPDPEMPDVIELMSAYDVTYDSSTTTAEAPKTSEENKMPDLI
ncbi:MAG: leucine-rich repeat domain-containing protein [Muricoprocola sp.]